jgi:hypothetical protein
MKIDHNLDAAEGILRGLLMVAPFWFWVAVFILIIWSLK